MDGAAMVGQSRGFHVGQNGMAYSAMLLADGLLNALNKLAKKARVARKNNVCRLKCKF